MSTSDDEFAKELARVRFWTWRVLVALAMVCTTCAYVTGPR